MTVYRTYANMKSATWQIEAEFHFWYKIQVKYRNRSWN